MSGAARTEVRRDARIALGAMSYMSDFTEISAWASSVDADTLPVWALATPVTPREGETQDSYRNEISLVVTVKRAGGEDIEDRLDADADVLDAGLVAALRRHDRACDLTRTETRIDGAGETRIGTLNMIFTVVVWTANP